MPTTLAHDTLHFGGDHRRAFLKGALLLLTGGAAYALGARLAPAAPPLITHVDSLQRSQFTKQIGTMFQVHHDTLDVQHLQLSAIRELLAVTRMGLPRENEHSFSLMFKGSIDHGLDQGTYTFTHGQIGSFPLFIVPMRPDADARYYEVVFNRMRHELV